MVKAFRLGVFVSFAMQKKVACLLYGSQPSYP